MTFHYDRPDAQTVQLAGEFNDWKGEAMTKDAQGNWTITLPLAPGSYGCKFLVNGIENSAIEVADISASATDSSACLSATAQDPRDGFERHAGRSRHLLRPALGQRANTGGRRRKSRDSTAKIARSSGDFDPQESWPLPIINSTVGASSIDLLAEYRQATLAAAWVILAADATVQTGQRQYPAPSGRYRGGPRFPYRALACGEDMAAGFSGGAKRSGFVAAALFRERCNVIGILMGGCNEDTATAGLKRFSPFNFTALPIFSAAARPIRVKAVEQSRGERFPERSFRDVSGQAQSLFRPHHGGAAMVYFVCRRACDSHAEVRFRQFL